MGQASSASTCSTRPAISSSARSGTTSSSARKVWWDKNKIPYQILKPEDVRKSFPVISIDDITAVLYEPDAGVVRARRAAQAVAAVFEKLGGKIVIGRASPSKISNGKLEEITLDTGATLRADTFVYCVGPWLGKTFPELFAKKTRAPIGYVCYFGTPINDQRFTYPESAELQLPWCHGLAGAAGGQPRLPRAWRRARAGRKRARLRTRRGAERRRTRGRERQRDAAGANAQPASRARPRQRRGAAVRPTAGDGRGGRGGGGGGRGGGGGGAGGGGDGGTQPADVPPQQQDPDTSDRWADQTRIDGSRRFVAHRFPILKDAPIAQTHACHYESTVEQQLHHRQASAHRRTSGSPPAATPRASSSVRRSATMSRSV